jgi:chorismate synthase
MNKFGELFSFTTFGESHGEAIGCLIDGCPAKIPLQANDIQKHLDKRRPGQSKFTTQRQEADEVKILSGVFESQTTGTPIALIIHNQDHRSHDYGDIKDKFRPSHADYTYFKKYGIRDYRGGGRSSARETAMRVASGAVARKITEQYGIEIYGHIIQIGQHKININNIDFNEINNNDLFCADKSAVDLFSNYLLDIRKNGDSVGAMIEIIAKNVPIGLGEPIYNKLDARLASAMMSINAVKSVEIGMGAQSASMTGSMVCDEMFNNNGKIEFSANHSGGVIGGISSGQDLIVRFAVKPTSSILIPRKTIDIYGNNTEIITKGRHDPCVGIRAVVVGEAMMACVLADFILLNNARKIF